MMRQIAATLMTRYAWCLQTCCTVLRCANAPGTAPCRQQPLLTLAAQSSMRLVNCYIHCNSLFSDPVMSPTESCVFSHLQHSCLQIVERGCALLGYAPIGLMAFVVLATRVRPAATLPGGHLVRLVADSRWLQVPLQVCIQHVC